MRIDAHQHFWRYEPEEYPWIKEDWPIRRDFLPADLQRCFAEVPMDGSVAVQARQTVEETRWLLELAEEVASIRGVVGWVDLQSPQLEETLAELSEHPRLVGVRHVVQDEPDDAFMLRPEFQRGIRLLKDYDLTYDILIFPRQLPAAIELVRAFPEQPFVLDHLAKPFIRERTVEPWCTQIRELAWAPNVMCKLSGMVTEATWHGWKPDHFRPFLAVVLEAFGAKRLMFGSDWPVCLLSGSYGEVSGLVEDYISALSPEDRAAIMGGNATRFYGL